MSDQHSEWMAIGDFMAGIVGVLVLFFVIATLITAVAQVEASQRKRLQTDQQNAKATQTQPNTVTQADDATEAKKATEKALRIAAQKQQLTAQTQQLGNLLQAKQPFGVEVLPDQGIIRLQDSFFQPGSACLYPSQRQILTGDIGASLQQALMATPDMTVQIEGHAASNAIVPITGQTCAPFDDAYTFSSGRAREVRKALFPSESERLQGRISIIAFGTERPLNASDRAATANQRVEIHLYRNPQ